MHKYLGTLAAVVLSYQAIFGVSTPQAADWGSKLSQDIPKIEKYLKDAKEMDDLEKKVGQRTGKFTFFVILTDSNEDYINRLISVIQGKTDYKVRLEPMNKEQPDKFYYFILEPSATNFIRKKD